MNLLLSLLGSLKESISIIAIIFVLMVTMEYVVLKHKKKLVKHISKKNFSSYTIASLLGSIPGCIGTFAMDTLYMSGIVGFGGLIATMIATSGDEAFIMLSMAFTGELSFKPIIILTITLVIAGIIGGIIADKLKKRLGWKTCKKCEIVYHKEEEFKPKHFFKEHIYHHIIKKHLWQIFLWLFVAIFIINIVGENIALETLFSGSGIIVIFILAAIIGVLPISGPNVFLLVLFSQGLIPFSILLTNSIIQDGHGLLPIIGFSVNDALKIKLYNFIFGIVVGGTLLALGL
jgi:hypothetical protein